ncbi:thioesterase family protein [Olivibacter sp. SDN3]|uniref:thioesterase family protein n=1 Tax=Olivibacter sp. SDN3 TaxID=2764720 RepID=UPI0016514FBC|nr:thioesterase family protein [Olivibacter sp. SDN3]QNL50234.1 thioesterase family protein [Olivibacter sp. SDN3]
MDYITIRWADLDPNFHLRHSSYYDFAAQERISILNQYNITIAAMKEQQFGPVLFKEECEFKREITMTSKIYIETKLLRMKKDASFWIIRHRFLSDTNKLHAILKVEGSWMDTIKRKLAKPVPKIVYKGLYSFPKTDDFEYIQ